MGTNYYADFKLGSSPDASNAITYRMHIGKQSGPLGIGIFCGRHFASMKEWEAFLIFNKDCITIKNEYEDELDLEEFLEKNFWGARPGTGDASQSQVEWLRDHSIEILEEPEWQAWRNSYWIDENTERLFYSGEFS